MSSRHTVLTYYTPRNTVSYFNKNGEKMEFELEGKSNVLRAYDGNKVISENRISFAAAL